MNVALTGGIGSGKSLVSRIFERLGVPVFYSDIVAANIISSNLEVITQLKEVFGNSIFSDDVIDRKKLAGIVFTDKTLLNRLNQIVHPVVFNYYNDWLNGLKSDYSIFESAIIFENSYEKLFDKIINVYAPTELRLNRVMVRDNAEKSDVVARMNNQLDDKIKFEKADYNILNDEKSSIIKQVLNIHNDFINYNKSFRKM